MLAIVVSRADEASVAIGESLREVEDWDETTDDSRSDAEGGGSVYRTSGAAIREFEERHLDLVRPVDAFDDPDEIDVLVFASKHAGDTGRLLTAHHTGNFGPADHGGEDDALARACPNALATVVDSLTEHAPPEYDVGVECTHHGPTDVGAPSMFVEVGSGPDQWADDRAARAVARAVLDLRGVPPDRSSEGGDEKRRHLVGFGGGHYAPRFERILRETDWAVGHVAADWSLDAMADPASPEGRDVIEAAFRESAAAYAIVADDRPDLRETIADLGYRVVGETWVRETDGVALDLVSRLEAEVATIADGLRFGDRAAGHSAEYDVVTLPEALLEVVRGIDQDATLAALDARALAYTTDQDGSRPTETIVLPGGTDREAIVVAFAEILEERYDEVERDGDELVARESAFDPDLAATLGVPEGPKFGRLAAGEPVEVDGREIPPAEVRTTRVDRFNLR